MRMHTMIICTAIVAGGAAQADSINDPLALQTHHIETRASYFIFNAEHSEAFTPASYGWECSNSMVGLTDCASIEVLNQTAERSMGLAAGSDQISFEWSNLNLYSPFGSTATGLATTSFSLEQDGMISMAQMENLGSMAQQASWSINLFNDSNQLLGNLDQIGDTYELEAERTYRLAFEIGGSDTRTTAGDSIRWGLGIAYAESPPAVVPGFGGLALFTSCGLRRRRRRK